MRIITNLRRSWNWPETVQAVEIVEIVEVVETVQVVDGKR